MSRLPVILGFVATPAVADPEQYGHMMDWGYGYGIGMMFGPVLWLVILGLVVAGIIWLVRRLDGEMSGKPTSNNGLAELDMRLARGEIEIEEYIARKKALTS